MANADTIGQVADVILSNPDRKYIVVSAPGKREKDDIKVTDLLYQCFNEAAKNGNCAKSFAVVKERFQDIIDNLGIDLDLSDDYDEIEKKINSSTVSDYAASRGEYLSAKILAKKIGYDFLDSAEFIKFNSERFQFHYSLDLLRTFLEEHPRAVIPGFYGSNAEGEIRTFPRGGSDISGAIVARAASADVYENWTDVNGFMSADPRVVDNPTHIEFLSYRELRELSYMGANVLHPESIFPVRSVGIPINIKNTFEPSHQGTTIMPDDKVPENDDIITGIAGKKGFTIIFVEKSMMNTEVGFCRKVLSVLEYENISFEHIPSGIDTLCVVVNDDGLQGKMQKVVEKIRDTAHADSVEIHSGISLIATVGHNMAARLGTAATLFTALAKAHVNIRMIDQGSSELNIIVGIDTPDYEKAINAVYYAFKKESKAE